MLMTMDNPNLHILNLLLDRVRYVHTISHDARTSIKIEDIWVQMTNTYYKILQLMLDETEKFLKYSSAHIT